MEENTKKDTRLGETEWLSVNYFIILMLARWLKVKIN